MFKIVLIGCGSIGSRHFQSLLELNLPAQYHLCDIHKDNIESTLNITKLKKPRYIFTYMDINELPSDIDLLIIATNSNVRFDIIKKIYKNCTPKFLILEKFLFQNVNDYHYINELFNNSITKVWVNQNYTMQEGFTDIASYFFYSKKIIIEIEGGNWGLCGNSVHYIDFFDYITGRKDKMYLKMAKFDSIISSKRNKFYEIFGKIHIETVTGSLLKLYARKNALSTNVKISISDEKNNKINIKHINNDLLCKFKINNKVFKKKYEIALQSKLSSIFAKEILTSGTCTLPSYSMSMRHHLLIIDKFKNYFDLNNISTIKGVPIT